MPTDNKGLTSEEAKQKLAEFGQNKLPETPPPSSLSILFLQLKNPLVYILIVAGLVTFSLGHFSDSTIIFFVVFINTILGFISEKRANNALQALKKLIHLKTLVIRDGKQLEIDVENLVPWDVVILSQGDKIPADGKLVEDNRFFVDESILTGESVSVPKKTGGEVYMGTIVASGKALMQVNLTGANTTIGKIASKVQEEHEDTPLKKQLTAFSKQLSKLVFLLTAIVMFVGLLRGRELVEIFTTSVALAVSSIPEGLLVGLTVVLAIGMQRILKRKGLVRHLVSAETLGGVTTICTDKTGTLTVGQMQVVETLGEEKDLTLQMIVANDLDDPIVISGSEWAKTKISDSKLLIEKHKRLDSIPFSPKTRFFMSLNKWDEANNMVFVNGAPDFLLKWATVDANTKKEIEKQIKTLTESGKRVVGFARKKVATSKKTLTESDAKNSLHWVGILAFSDPVREGVKEALEKTKKAGINTIVITGDYSQTAMSVMKELGINVEKSECMEGEDLARLNIAELQNKLKGENRIKLFARTNPEQKLKIIEALKNSGEVVAMMGDGVNDAPALKKADIGIVVGEATDVAKETADLILMDSSFATIVASIEEGRGIFDNIRKIILYLMSDAFEEIIAVVGTLLLGLPLPVTASQILWINLVSDGFPNLALTIDPKPPGSMEKPPRDPKDPLVSKWMKMLIGIISLVGGFIALGLFIYYLKTTGNVIMARSVAFLALGLNSLIFVFSVRTLTKPFWTSNVFENKWLNLSVLVGLVFQFIPFSTEGLRSFFGLKFPGLTALIVVIVSSLLVFIIIEGIKSLIRKNLEWFQH